ncbi:GntR family transcriptional regulator [Oceanibium sediminis]|uniref:GntR family transcriptional regulator n=1 Tax=Oceanibium sediminis TaxID=2026339 RepID=UPI0018E57992|nr:GntR family transcriptional regulator [Oceanibium sediminis]
MSLPDTDLSGGVAARVETDFRTLPEKAAEDLRRRILLGEFAPGETLPERETATALGVSRTPLREALRILANEGLVDIRPARSPSVANPTAAELSQLFSVMRVLEALAGELTCISGSDAQIAGIGALHEALSEIDPAESPIDFFNADMAFHKAIAVASGNEPLLKTHKEYNARLWRARFLTSRVRTDRERILREHGDIVAGLEARDTRWTSAVLDSHLRSANRKIVAILEESGA